MTNEKHSVAQPHASYNILTPKAKYSADEISCAIGLLQLQRSVITGSDCNLQSHPSISLVPAAQSDERCATPPPPANAAFQATTTHPPNPNPNPNLTLFQDLSTISALDLSHELHRITSNATTLAYLKTTACQLITWKNYWIVCFPMGEKDAQITVARYFLEKIRGMMVTMRQPCGENRLGDGGNMNIEVGADGNMVINMATEDDGTGEHDAYRETLKAAFTLCRMRYRGDD